MNNLLNRNDRKIPQYGSSRPPAETWKHLAAELVSDYRVYKGWTCECNWQEIWVDLDEDVKCSKETLY